MRNPFSHWPCVSIRWLAAFLTEYGLLLGRAPAPAQPLPFCVDPIISTGGYVFSGANMVLEKVLLGPQNIFMAWAGGAGYPCPDSLLTGSSRTHLSVTGAPNLGEVLVVPCTGPLQNSNGRPPAPRQGYRARSAPQREKTQPNYYALTFADYKIQAELNGSGAACGCLPPGPARWAGSCGARLGALG